jgi:methylmalonyl-CoA mutase N-terminal domain/subunit
MTDKVEADTEAYFERILAQSDDGSITAGLLRGIESGWFMSEIADAAFAYQQALEKGTKRIVGVNVHHDPDERELEVLKISADVERAQSARLADFRAARDAGKTGQALEVLRVAARGDANLVPVIMDAIRADATLGEISQALKDVFGVYREPPVI